MKETKRKVATTISIVLITLLVAALANWAQLAADQAVLNSTRNELEEMVEQLDYALERTISDSRSNLALLADYAAKADATPDTAVQFLQSQSQVDEFDNLYFIDLEGNGVSENGVQKDFSQNETFLHALDKQFHIDKPHVAESNGGMVFDFAVPVQQEGVVTAILYCEATLESFKEILMDATYQAGYVYILSSDLSLVFCNNPEYVGIDAISQEAIALLGEQNLQVADEHVAQNQIGSFTYQDEVGVRTIFVYTTIAMTDWTLAFNIQEETINSELFAAVTQLKLVCQLIYWSLVLLILYTWISQRRVMKMLEKTAYYDTLTGLPNMAKFKREVGAVLQRSHGRRYSILKTDIENFRVINDLFGLEVGNRILQAVKTYGDELDDTSLIMARIGTDEFMMFAQSDLLQDIDYLDAVAVQHFSTKIPEVNNHHISFKSGRYEIEQGETDIDSIINKASLAHKIAKATKGMSFCDYDDAFKKQALKDAEITNKMQAALENEEFKIYLQPKVSANEEQLVGAEALVRWIEADGGFIFPNEFIPLFERNGFIVALDQYILSHVCMTIKRWMEEGLGSLTVSVNCSRLNLENPQFVEEVVRIVDTYQIPHDCIEIELTESTTIERGTTIEEVFADLHQNGFKISIDDFGAGYSSLGMLRNLHVDTLKMDRSFFVQGKNVRRDDMLIDSIVKLSHNLGMYVVAEGIETAEQVATLRSMNCDAIQGFYYSKPLSVSDFEAKYTAEMIKKSVNKVSDMPLICDINNARYANSLVPCGILVVRLDEGLTITEANEGYFTMMGFSRKEIRTQFQNRALDLVHEEDLESATTYLLDKIQTSLPQSLVYSCRVATKDRGYIPVQLNGRSAENEHGEMMLYFSVTDMSSYNIATEELHKERDFNARIASLTKNVFFDYDRTHKTIRFSKNFAEKFSIPDTVENFLESEIGHAMFPVCADSLEEEGCKDALSKSEGEICLTLPNGDPMWYLFGCETLYDEQEQCHRTVGKMTETVGSKLEMELLKIKAEMAAESKVFGEVATKRYIRNYLRLANTDRTIGTFFVIHLEAALVIKETFGHAAYTTYIKEVGDILRNALRSCDIIGMVEEDRFFVFVSQYRTPAFIERKAAELCSLLQTTYRKEGATLPLVVRMGAAFYPEAGNDFAEIYHAAVTVLDQMGPDDTVRFFE